MPYFRISQKDFKSSFNIMFLEFLKLPQKSVGPSQFLPLGSTHFLGPSSPGFSPFPWPIFPGLSPRPKPPLATLQRQHALQDVHTSRARHCCLYRAACRVVHAPELHTAYSPLLSLVLVAMLLILAAMLPVLTACPRAHRTHCAPPLSTRVLPSSCTNDSILPLAIRSPVHPLCLTSFSLGKFSQRKAPSSFSDCHTPNAV